MPRKKQSKGKCVYCGLEVAKNGVTRHLGSCTQFQEAIAKTGHKKSDHEPLFNLSVQAAGMPEFWLNIEMRGSAKLKDLDNYLRSIWLECCNHGSQFSFGGWQGEEIGRTRRLVDVLEVGEELTHIHDPGTSSETIIKAVGVRNGNPLTPHPITLLARNIMPECLCMECKQPATWICPECLRKDVRVALCDEHAKVHSHGSCGDPLPLVNSPRVGKCIYSGPAEPPY